MAERQTSLYCQKAIKTWDKTDTEYLRNFYPHIGQVRMCEGKERKPIFECVVTETTEDKADGWGWWDNERKSFNIVFASKAQVEICFPYGYKIEEQLGKGHLLPVSFALGKELENK